MSLLDYLKSLDVAAQGSFAARCKTPLGSLYQIARGHRPCMEWRAIEIERESRRKVTCEELCPQADWAYLRGTTRRQPSRQVG
jgi:DNA-binding transcriptional regulator YdaS (Cro superfamily)